MWQLRGRYPNRGFPRIFNDATVGPEAKKLYDEAQAMLADFVAHKRVRLNGVVGLYPAAAVGDDIEVYADEQRSVVTARLCGLRQQAEKDGAEPYYCLSDFVAPRDTGLADYVGMFACSSGEEERGRGRGCVARGLRGRCASPRPQPARAAPSVAPSAPFPRPHLSRATPAAPPPWPPAPPGHGLEEVIAGFKAAGDDYSYIMAEALADRLAEALAEKLHELVRRRLWGYAPDEAISVDDMLKVKYQVRPGRWHRAGGEERERQVRVRIVDVLQ